MARAVAAHLHPVAAGLRIAPASPTARGSIDEQPAAATVAARTQASPFTPERDEQGHEQVAELGPALVLGGKGPVGREPITRAAEQRVAPTHVRPNVTADERPNRVTQQSQPS